MTSPMMEFATCAPCILPFTFFLAIAMLNETAR
jgi:hypothetical protein